ncbi:MAG: caspase family protein [Cellvibrionaceae bacterium]
MWLPAIRDASATILGQLTDKAHGARLLALSSVLLLTACNTTPVADSKLPANAVETADLYVVDCLLPGQIRRLGAMTYLAPRRPIRTTAVDCRIRGGEYVAYDRADYRSALKVWLPMAQDGDAEAQTYVGEIFEKGIGQTPDYASAFTWYSKAAEQGFVRGQINLGYLYEKGLGVKPDVAKALNWYRKASGLSDDQLVYESDANQALGELRAELTEKVTVAEQQADVLKGQIDTLRSQRKKLIAKQGALRNQLQQQSNEEQKQQLDAANTELALAKREIDILSQLYNRADEEREQLKTELDTLPKLAFRNVPPPAVLEPLKLDDSSPRTFDNINFGRYFALIIGNQDYLYMEDLRSPLQDAERLQDILESKYGFSTILLPDASEKNILNALNDLYEQIGPNDNLLIYYAGHGNLTQSPNSQRQRGYWLPVDAQTDRFTNWISNTVISDHLDRLKARSVLVVADSCYAGNMASDKSPFLLGSVNTKLTDQSIKTGLSRRSRLVISSGGVKPVLDGIGGQHSMFAGSLIDILDGNNQVLRDNMLFARLTVNIRRRNQIQEVIHAPEMRPIRAAGHGGGDFYFVPKSVQVSTGLAESLFATLDKESK